MPAPAPLLSITARAILGPVPARQVMADRVGVAVQCDFNGYPARAVPGDDPEDLAAAHDRYCRNTDTSAP